MAKEEKHADGKDPFFHGKLFYFIEDLVGTPKVTKSGPPGLDFFNPNRALGKG
jgi:hypothetical protein